MNGPTTIRRSSLYCGVAAALLALAISAGAVDVGAPAPNCALTSLDRGQRYELSEFEGKVLWVDFWASWCGPCAESFAFLDSVDREFRAQGLQMVGINVDEQPQDAMSFLEKHPVSFTQTADASGRCPREFGVEGMPASYLVDRDGRIRHIYLGFRPGEASALRDRVKELLRETETSDAPP
ncbi:MAG TPA: TlpA disulfide reductase family protein [Myxococcota bacterium]|nr:TlpA disulfide reductase family protein [Myxococcota bacterium]